MNSHAMQNFDKTWIEAWYEEMTIYVICTDQNDMWLTSFAILKFRTRNVRGTVIVLFGKDSKEDRTKDKISMY